MNTKFDSALSQVNNNARQAVKAMARHTELVGTIVAACAIGMLHLVTGVLQPVFDISDTVLATLESVSYIAAMAMGFAMLAALAAAGVATRLVQAQAKRIETKEEDDAWHWKVHDASLLYAAFLRHQGTPAKDAGRRGRQARNTALRTADSASLLSGIWMQPRASWPVPEPVAPRRERKAFQVETGAWDSVDDAIWDDDGYDQPDEHQRTGDEWRAQAVFQKFKAGEKLTTEDLLALQVAGLL